MLCLISHFQIDSINTLLDTRAPSYMVLQYLKTKSTIPIFSAFRLVVSQCFFGFDYMVHLPYKHFHGHQMWSLFRSNLGIWVGSYMGFMWACWQGTASTASVLLMVLVYLLKPTYRRHDAHKFVSLASNFM